jgi:hypothetical protein
MSRGGVCTQMRTTTLALAAAVAVASLGITRAVDPSAFFTSTCRQCSLGTAGAGPCGGCGGGGCGGVVPVVTPVMAPSSGPRTPGRASDLGAPFSAACKDPPRSFRLWGKGRGCSRPTRECALCRGPGEKGCQAGVLLCGCSLLGRSVGCSPPPGLPLMALFLCPQVPAKASPAMHAHLSCCPASVRPTPWCVHAKAALVSASTVKLAPAPTRRPPVDAAHRPSRAAPAYHPSQSSPA